MHSVSPLKLIHKAALFENTFQSQGGSIERFTNTNKPTPRCRIPHLELLSFETSKKEYSHKSCFYYSVRVLAAIVNTEIISSVVFVCKFEEGGD